MFSPFICLPGILIHLCTSFFEDDDDLAWELGATQPGGGSRVPCLRNLILQYSCPGPTIVQNTGYYSSVVLFPRPTRVLQNTAVVMS